MFSFFKKKLRSVLSPEAAEAPATPPPPASASPDATPPAAAAPPPTARLKPPASTGGSMIGSALVTPIDIEQAIALTVAPERQRWFGKLQQGLRKTGTSISTVFTGSKIDEQLYEDLETALLMADAGVGATAHLLEDVRRRVKEGGMTHPVAVKNALVEAITVLLRPLEKPLVIGEFQPTVIMVTGVNGAGKTTSIGKLTRHLANEGASVLLAAADTFRAAAREQLSVWADRNMVEIVSQQGGDPAAVSFDAVTAGKARGKDVVLVDTAGRLPTQLHLMEELRKIKRVIQKTGPADAGVAAGPPQGDTAPEGLEPAAPSLLEQAWTGDRGEASRELRPARPRAVRAATSVGAIPPHEILLVIDGNTGQNALAQVKAFDDTLQLTGLVITKLDGTAKGGVLAAIALWARERAKTSPQLRPVAVYFIGVGEKLEDLETFNAREFAQALLG